MAVATFSIGLIPSYASIGIWSPVLLYAARLVQGFSTGGEYSGASTFVTEFAPDRQRGFLASFFLEVGTISGCVAGAALVTGRTAALGDAAMEAWGWRVPFLLAGPLGIIGLLPAAQALGDASLRHNGRTRARAVRRMPAYYAMLAALVGLFAVLLMQETSGRPLEGSAPTISIDEAHGQQTAAAVAQ
jgi:MFS family permease